ncbi:oligosaccharide flippase family protein [Fulvivirga sp. M361]|uniref:lipopolysaccharide biosynthesis protein n=1 Tax=Fulvivirga sp. M361 TaxID=2594266 RepID=UPI00117BDABE|nr:MATE family efflux transporter [Fulvivirga sp. M361]TRX62140.1 oligosaccharide flippase family protein [Fulvivirga sp. M361]
MGIVAKSSLKYSIILYTGIVLGYVNIILIFPNVLTEEEFGLTRILASASAVIAQVAQLGSGNIIMRFHPYLKDDAKNTTLSIGLIISVTGLIIATLLVMVFQDTLIEAYEEKSAMFTDYFYLLIPFLLSLVFYNLFDAYLRVIFKNSVSAFLNFILLRVLWLSVILLYHYDLVDTTTFINLYVLCQAFVAIAAFLYINYLGVFNITLSFSKEKLRELKKMSSFGLFTVLSGISFFLINRLDILMVGKYVGLQAVAIYSIAFNMSSVILVPSQSIARTTMVLVAEAFKKRDFNVLNDIYKKTALNQLLFGALIFILIAVNYNSLMQFLPPNYQDSFYVFILLGLTKILDSAFGVNSAVILNSKYFKYDTMLSLMLLITTVATNMYFIPLLGVEGAALATAISIVAFNIGKYFIIRQKLKLTPFNANYFKALTIYPICYFIPFYIPSTGNVFVDVGVKSSCIITLFTGLVYYMKVSSDFNSLVLMTIGWVTKKTFKH